MPRLRGVKIHALIQQNLHGEILELLRRLLPHPSPPLIKGRGQMPRLRGVRIFANLLTYAPTASFAAYITSKVITV
jgi:hypothetical protein